MVSAYLLNARQKNTDLTSMLPPADARFSRQIRHQEVPRGPVHQLLLLLSQAPSRNRASLLLETSQG